MNVFFFKRINKEYGRHSLQAMRHFDIIKILDLYFFKQKNKINLLDVGCGNFELLHQLNNKNYNIYGCDWIKHEKLPKNINYKQININSQGLSLYKDNFFDLIICSDVIEHLESPGTLLKEISRCLKNNGVAIISFPNSWNLFERVRFMFTANFKRYRSERNSEPWGHISFFTTNILESLCDRAKLSVNFITGGISVCHMALKGYYIKLPSSLLFSYNVYIYLTKKQSKSK